MHRFDPPAEPPTGPQSSAQVRAIRQADPALTRPDLANRIARNIVDHFRTVLGSDAVDEAIRETGLDPARLAEREGWVSQEFAIRFEHAVLRRLAGSSGPFPHDHPVWQHFRLANRRGFTREAMGLLFHVLRGFGSPGTVYRNVPVIGARTNRMTRAEIVEQTPGRVVLRMKAADPDWPDRISFCWARLGLLEAAPLPWGLPLARVEHARCIHDPLDPSEWCEYVVTYEDRAFVGALPTVLPPVLAAALVGVPVGLAVSGWVGAVAGLAASGWAAAALQWVRGARERREHREGAQRMLEVLDEADEKCARLWQDRAALRRAILANRKISGYLAPDLVDRIMADPESELQLGGMRTDAAVLFADLADFTTRCEQERPEAALADLNTFFAHMDPIVLRHGGVIDKRIGDSLMAVFVERPGDADGRALRVRAAECALEMLAEVGACNDELARGARPPIRVRFGVAAGPVVQGNVGTGLRYEHTVVGDTANRAARLQQNAAPDHVLMDRAVADVLPRATALGTPLEIKVRGRGGPVPVVDIAAEGVVRDP